MFNPGQRVWVYSDGSFDPKECTFIRPAEYEFHLTRVLVRYPDDAEDYAENSENLYPTLLAAKIAQAEWTGGCLTKARRQVREAEAKAAHFQVQLDKRAFEIMKLQGKDYV